MSENVLRGDPAPEALWVRADRMRGRGMEGAPPAPAAEALDLAAKESFDAVILDLQMPKMDGIEALKALKADQPEAQIIFLTGHATVEKGIEAMKLGAMDFVEKPADLNKLSEKIRSAKAQKMIIVEKQTEEKIRDIMVGRPW